MKTLIFTVPKPFLGSDATRQYNAVRSWSLLHNTEIRIYVDDPQAKLDLAFDQLTTVSIPSKNAHGTPYLDSIFQDAHDAATRYDRICYVNSDIVLGPDFQTALQNLRFERFLMVGQRANIDLSDDYTIHTEQDVEDLQSAARHGASFSGLVGSDYFCFTPQSGFDKLPRLVVGRAAWDNWMMYRAREMGIPLVDASNLITAVHQNHGYKHIDRGWIKPNEIIDTWDGVESRHQRKLVGNHCFDLRHCSHRFSASGDISLASFDSLAAAEDLLYKRRYPVTTAKGLLRRLIVRCPLAAKKLLGVYTQLPLLNRSADPTKASPT